MKETVRQRYAQIARDASGCCCGSSGCCGPAETPQALIDYGELDDLLPPGANLGLGCGTPILFADIQPGQTVVDLGSGAGVDAFLAAQRVGPEGHVIGIDMTPEMIQLARRNAIIGGYPNVQFHLGEIENLPLEDESVDVVISNCVINLAPDKARVFAEIFRVLRPGGRVCISDTVSYGEVPASIRQDPELWSECFAGAMDIQEYLNTLRAAGFVDVRISHRDDLDSLRGEDYGFASITVTGTKP